MAGSDEFAMFSDGPAPPAKEAREAGTTGFSVQRDGAPDYDHVFSVRVGSKAVRMVAVHLRPRYKHSALGEKTLIPDVRAFGVRSEMITTLREAGVCCGRARERADRACVIGCLTPIPRARAGRFCAIPPDSRARGWPV